MGRGFGGQVLSTVVAQGALLVLSVASSAILARWLGVEGKGMVSLALLIPMFLGLFLNSGVGVANVYFAGSGRLGATALAGNSVAFSVIGTGMGAALFALLVVSGWLARIVPQVPAHLIVIAMTGLPVALLSHYFGTILQGLQHIVALNLVNLGRGAVALALTVVSVALLGWGSSAAIVSSVMAAVAGVIWMATLLRCQGVALRPRWQRSVWLPTLSFGLRGHIGNVLQFFNYRADMFIVNYFLGPAGVGIYSISVTVAELLWQLPNAVGFVIGPKAAATNPALMNAFTPRVLRITLVLTTLAALGLAVLGSPLIELVYSAKFGGAYMPMLALLPGVVLLGGSKVLTNEIGGRGYPQLNSANSAIALVMTVVLDLLLIPRHGVLGAAVASSVAYSAIFLTAIGSYLYVSRQAGHSAEALTAQAAVPK